MPTYPFMQVDAFTTQRLAGNPCAILFESDNLDDDTMLAIAREMNLSETSFVFKSEVADIGARYFTPGGEIPLEIGGIVQRIPETPFHEREE